MESLTKKPPYWDEFPCPYCGGNVIFTTNARIYHGREYGNGKCYLCIQCEASVGVQGCGKNGKKPTRRPLGVLADTRMKSLKQACHSLFDPVWRYQPVHRGDCYRKLAVKMHIRAKHCHFGWFNETDLNKALAILKEPDWWQ